MLRNNSFILSNQIFERSKTLIESGQRTVLKGNTFAIEFSIPYYDQFVSGFLIGKKTPSGLLIDFLHNLGIRQIN